MYNIIGKFIGRINKRGRARKDLESLRARYRREISIVRRSSSRFFISRLSRVVVASVNGKRQLSLQESSIRAYTQEGFGYTAPRRRETANVCPGRSTCFEWHPPACVPRAHIRHDLSYSRVQPHVGASLRAVGGSELSHRSSAERMRTE